ncbi:MAG: 1-acyl-sn-glycerol-3-phosphate acyltransferase [Ginsengibacter sp.]
MNDKKWLNEKGPLLIAANHPNSFLDAIIVSTLFKKPVFSLARGDAFAGKFFTTVLTSLNMLPVYRITEGAENIGRNYSTFQACQKLFKDNKIVLIFSEGRCINEWHLRPLKKGTARLALDAWQNDIPLKVLPLGINYSSFRFYGKNVKLNFGSVILKEDFNFHSQGKAINEFNDELTAQLSTLVYEIDKKDISKLREVFFVNNSTLKNAALIIPAAIGFIINSPLYFLFDFIIKNRSKDHYDSIMTGLLFLFYPLYVLAITMAVFLISKSWYSLLIPVLLPFTAWSYLQLKRQIPK